MAVDTPAKVAIIGAGPIGLEAALYARYLGYDVDIFEFREVCWHVQQNAAQQMFAPFGWNSSSLGLSAIHAHDETYSPPAPDALITYGEWYERYLMPLSETDLIADFLHRLTWVQWIGKVELTKVDRPRGEYDRGNWDFRLHSLEIKKGSQGEITTADVLLDCGGCNPTRIGHGGIPASGEQHFHKRIEFVVGPGENYLGKTVLVVGDELSAAAAVVKLAELGGDTKIIWTTRHERDQTPLGPIPTLSDDPLPQRQALAAAANCLALSDRIEWLPGLWVEAIQENEAGRVLVDLSGERDQQIVVDRIIAGTGCYPDWSFAKELQLDICPITDAPRPFSEYLLQRPSPYSIEYPAPNPAILITSEPNYYVLGSKTFGRMPGYLHRHGLQQIRDVFTILGDRQNLDLYTS